MLKSTIPNAPFCQNIICFGFGKVSFEGVYILWVFLFVMPLYYWVSQEVCFWYWPYITGNFFCLVSGLKDLVPLKSFLVVVKVENNSFINAEVLRTVINISRTIQLLLNSWSKIKASSYERYEKRFILFTIIIPEYLDVITWRFYWCIQIWIKDAE